MHSGESRRRWLALATLALAVLLAMAPWFTTAAIVAPLRRDWRITSLQAGWLTIAAQIGFVAGALISALANLADLVRPRWLMLGGGLAAAGANAALTLCHSFATAWPWRFLTGACLALVYPPALKLMATWFRQGRGVALGIMVGALTVGGALPHLAGALQGEAWRPIVLVTSMLTAAGGVWAGCTGREGPFPFAPAHFDPREIATVFARRGVRLATLGYFGHMWELIAMWSWIGPFLATAFLLHGHADGAAAATFVVIALGGVGCWLGGVFSDRRSRAASAAVAMLISAACSLLIGWLLPAPLFLLLAVAAVWGFAVVADSAQFSVLITELADPRFVGTALTTQLGMGFTLAGVTVWLIPWIQSHWGWGWAFASLAPGPALGILAMARLRLPVQPVNSAPTYVAQQ